MYKLIPDVDNALKRTRKLTEKEKKFIIENKDPIHEKLNIIRNENNLLSKIIYELTYNFFNLFEQNHQDIFSANSYRLIDRIFNYPFRRNKNNTLKLRYGFTPEQFMKQKPSDELTNFIHQHFVDYLVSAIRFNKINILSDFGVEHPLFYNNENKTQNEIEIKIDQVFSKIESIRHILGPLVQKLHLNVREINILTNQFFNELNKKQYNGEEIFGFVIQGILFPIGKKFKLSKIRGSSWLYKKNACVPIRFLEDDRNETISLSNVVFIK
jgi:hypothetical protein